MASRPDEIFSEIDSRLSLNPALNLYELERQLGYTHRLRLTFLCLSNAGNKG